MGGMASAVLKKRRSDTHRERKSRQRARVREVKQQICEKNKKNIANKFKVNAISLLFVTTNCRKFKFCAVFFNKNNENEKKN